MVQDLVKPGEFLAVRHSVLNGNTYKIDSLVEETLGFGRYTHERSIVPCFEGDIIQVEETREIVLTHQNFVPLSKSNYRDLKERKLAASLQEVLDKIAAYQQRNNQRVVLCLEPKFITSAATIDKTVQLLKEYGLTDVYFDSFFGGKLDAVSEANAAYSTAYATSLHLIGNVGSSVLMMTKPEKEFTVITVPYPMSFGNIGRPVIYGAVGSLDLLERISEHPHVQGAYVRIKEGAGLRGAITNLYNSVTNTENFRRMYFAI